MKEIIIGIIVGLVALAIMISALAYGLQKGEYAECKKWQAQADRYPGFYLTEWQKGQCDANNVQIDAPVR